ncbi:MAG TPA: helix-turn-helix transcriptional regulator [Herpetosiphonaceae bacterium]
MEEQKEQMRAFGQRVRELRLARGVSQEELALHCQVDRSYMGQVERGERNISLGNIHKIARGLDVPAHELLMPLGSVHSIQKIE